jgi:hypothetical protein
MKKSLGYLIVSCLIALTLAACAPKEEDKPEPVKPKIEGTQLIANAGTNSVTLDWTMNADAETYNIYYIADESDRYNSTNKPSKSTLLAGTKITGLISATRTITGLTNGTEYWFAITVVNNNGESDLSEIVAATPSDPAPPKAPQNVRANAGNGQITVTWDEVVGADKYKLYYSRMSSYLDIINEEIDDAGICLSGTCSEVITGLDNSTADNKIVYTIFITAFEGTTESSRSFGAFTSPSTSPPPFAPTMTAVTAGNGQITVTWNKVDAIPAVSSYVIYIGPAKGVLKSTGAPTIYEPDTGDGGPYTATATSGIENDKTYFIVITAVNANGESAESREWWATPSATSPESGELEDLP